MSTSLRVLMAEDNPDDVQLILRELHRANFEVTHKVVFTAEMLDEALGTQTWDLVLSDYSMPQFNGIEALSLVRQRNTDVPFIFVSGTLGEDMAVSAMKAGANDYVLKGNLKRLVPAINRELRDASVRREHRLAELRLKESEERFRHAFDHAGIGMALVGIDSHFMQVNPALCRMLGYNQETLLKTNHRNILYPKERKKFEIAVAGLLSQENMTCQLEVRYQKKQTKGVWALLNVSLVCSSNQVPLYFIFQAEDISARKIAEGKLKHLAHHDALTGLANRSLLAESIKQAIEIAKEKTHSVAVLFLDLDRFKMINDTLGHDVGDLFLQVVAKRLYATLRTSDIVARIGGDEFVIIIPQISDDENVIDVAQKIINSFIDPFMVKDQEFFVTTSIGISLYPHDGQDSLTLLKNADVAMYLAKEQGGNSYQFCTPDMPIKIHEKMMMHNALRHALMDNEFLLHYQPKVDINTGKIFGVEALVRWQRKSGELVSPLDFIPLAEETGLIVELGEWVLRTACQQNKRWHQQGFLISMAVNLSPRQLREGNALETIVHILKETDLAPDFLELEITEGMIMQVVEHNSQVLNALKEMGVKISIDDFGTGYSSLSYLKRFNVDRLKIDQSFIKNLPLDADNRAITSAVIAMAKTLNIQVIAEGVETKEQLEFLREHQCDEIQGYYFSRPIDAEKMTLMLEAGKELGEGS